MQLKTISRRGEPVHEIEGVILGEATDAQLAPFLADFDTHQFPSGKLAIDTEHGTMVIQPGDWIIRPVSGPVQFMPAAMEGQYFERVNGDGGAD